jgi:hypothetical protein
MKITRRAIVIIAAMLMAGLTWGANVAFAGTGQQYCNPFGECMNSWNGNPSGYVKTYGYSTYNNDFTVLATSTPCNHGLTTSTCPGNGIPANVQIDVIQVSGGSQDPGEGTCIMDYANNQYDAHAGTGSSCTGSVGWGAYVIEEDATGNPNCTGDVLFYDIHWNGYFVWPADGNGNSVYLNSNGIGTCMQILPPR